MKPHMVPELVMWQKQDRFHLAMESRCLCLIFTAFSIFFQLAKMASTVSLSCSSDKTVHYSTEQAMSMVMDDQSPNVLAAGSDSGSVRDFLCWLYWKWSVNKIKKQTNNSANQAHSMTSVASKASLNPFTAPACKISGMNDARMCCKQCIFRSYNISVQCNAFGWKGFHMPVRKRRQKGLFKFCIFMGCFQIKSWQRTG